MSGEYSMLLMRVVRGEESLATAFWVSLFLLVVFGVFEFYIPSLSDVFMPFYHFFHLFFITYTIAAIHHSCHDSALMWRLLARTYVILLMVGGVYSAYVFFGIPWAVGYPFIAIAFTFVVKE